MSRRLRVGLALLLGGLVLLRVPGRVEAQRDGVAELARERGGDAAGAAILAEVGDLRESWAVPAGSLAGSPEPTAGYEAALAAARRQRAVRAAARLAPGTTIPTIVLVDGDPYLVVPDDQGPPRLGASPTEALPPLSELLDAEDRALLEAHGVYPALEQVWAGLDIRAEAPAGAVRVASRVAWWPPIQERVEVRTGIPLQVGQEPPAGRVVLPTRRLAGERVWALPTPAGNAAITLLDGGGLLVLLLAGAVLLRELWAWRRDGLREKERAAARDGILQRLSHELRTPVASVRALLDALGADRAGSEQYLALARSEADRLAVGIDRLLQAARGDTAVRVDRIPLDLHEWGQSVVARWSARLPGLALRGAGPIPVEADPERLDEAVDALLDNALKYGGPRVLLEVAPWGLAVEDDGEGIPPAARERVMHKFERIEGRVNDPGGHGLGLWAAGEVARAHGGRLRVEGPSRFRLELR